MIYSLKKRDIMSKNERKVICPYCNLKFRTIVPTKMFCSNYCCRKYYRAINPNIKEMFRLSEQDKKVRNEYYGKMYSILL